MNILEQHIKDCLDKVAQIAYSYKQDHIESDHVEKSIDNLISTCELRLNRKIHKLELDIEKEESPIYGACIVSDDNEYDICFVKGLNYCWKRFVICKEVFHVVIDEEKYRNMSLDDHIEEATVSFPDNKQVASPSVTAELLAEIAAMEFMFPYADRLKEVIHHGESINHSSIAAKYKIPLVMVEKYLSDTYMKVLAKYSQVTLSPIPVALSTCSHI